MSYLGKLVTNAINVKAENAKLGNYRIEPQHGVNCYVYNIYKNKCFLSCISIVSNEITIQIANDYKGKELVEIVSAVKNLYPADWKIKTIH